MKTFDDLVLGDVVYGIDLIDYSIKEYIIIDINEYEYKNSKIFTFTYDNKKFQLTFKKDSFNDSDIMKQRVWTSDEKFKDMLAYVFNCGVSYCKRQIMKMLM